MKVKFVERAPAHVAYLRHTGPYGAPIERSSTRGPASSNYPTGAKMDPETGAFECRIVVPVAPL